MKCFPGIYICGIAIHLNRALDIRCWVVTLLMIPIYIVPVAVFLWKKSSTFQLICIHILVNIRLQLAAEGNSYSIQTWQWCQSSHRSLSKKENKQKLSFSSKTPTVCLSAIPLALKVLIGARNRDVKIYRPSSLDWFSLVFSKLTLTSGPLATVSSTRSGWCNKKVLAAWKNWNVRSFLLYAVALQSSFSTADCSDVFLTRDLGSNLCHYQSARPSWCHPDAPSWNTHRPLCLLHFKFRGFFFHHDGHALTHTQTHTHAYTNLQA